MPNSSNTQPKVEISYIGCEEIQEVTKILRWKKTNYLKQFSFNLRLLNLNLNEQGLDNKIFNKISELITLLKICLKPGKFFTHNQGMLDKTAGFVSGTLYIAQGKEEEKEKEQIRTLVWSIFTEIFGNKIDAHNFCTVVKEQKILEVLQKGITITLRANIKDIDLANFNKIKADLEEKLEQAENKEQSQIVLQAAQTEHTEQTQQETAQNTTNMQVVPFRGLFGCGVTNSGKQITRAPIVVAAMRDNFFWFISFIKPFNFFNTVQFFLRKPSELPTKNLMALTYHSEPQEQKHIGDEVDGRKRKRDRIASVISHFPGVGPAIGCVASYVLKEIDQSKKKKAEQLCQLGKSGKDQNIGQTTSRIDRFKAKRKKSKVKVEQTQEQLEEKQLTIKQAQNDARIALLNNKEGKKLDEIFIEIVSEYKNQDPETFRNIFNSVFNIVYFEDKRLHKILETDEVSEVLETLPIRKPMNNSLLDKEYLQEQAYREKEQLFKLVTGIDKQQPPAQPKNPSNESTNPPPSNVEKNKTPRPLPAAKSKRAKNPLAINTAFKSSLEIVFSSKEAYFCLFVIGVSISILCLWHLPLGKVPILQGLVPAEKREYIGWTLNIGLPILIALCVLNLADFIYSKYKEYHVESVKQIDIGTHIEI